MRERREGPPRGGFQVSQSTAHPFHPPGGRTTCLLSSARPETYHFPRVQLCLLLHIRPNQYTSWATIEENRATYTVILEFSPEASQELRERLPPDERDHAATVLAQRPSLLRFNTPILIGDLAATLGNYSKNDGDPTVSFNVLHVLPKNSETLQVQREYV